MYEDIGNKCGKCQNHDFEVLKKGHARDCPFKKCNCLKCRLLDARSDILQVISGKETKLKGTKKDPNCGFCQNHGVKILRKGHVRSCGFGQERHFKLDNCFDCEVHYIRNEVNRLQIKMRRAMKEDRTLSEEQRKTAREAITREEVEKVREMARIARERREDILSTQQTRGETSAGCQPQMELNEHQQQQQHQHQQQQQHQHQHHHIQHNHKQVTSKQHHHHHQQQQQHQQQSGNVWRPWSQHQVAVAAQLRHQQAVQHHTLINSHDHNYNHSQHNNNNLYEQQQQHHHLQRISVSSPMTLAPRQQRQARHIQYQQHNSNNHRQIVDSSLPTPTPPLPPPPPPPTQLAGQDLSLNGPTTTMSASATLTSTNYNSNNNNNNSLDQPLALVQPNTYHEQQQLLNTLSLFRLIAQFVQTPQPQS